MLIFWLYLPTGISKSLERCLDLQGKYRNKNSKLYRKSMAYKRFVTRATLQQIYMCTKLQKNMFSNSVIKNQRSTNVALVSLLITLYIFHTFFWCFYWATSKTWTWSLDLEQGPRPWKTWTLKKIEPGKHGINMGLKTVWF